MPWNSSTRLTAPAVRVPRVKSVLDEGITLAVLGYMRVFSIGVELRCMSGTASVSKGRMHAPAVVVDLLAGQNSRSKRTVAVLRQS